MSDPADLHAGLHGAATPGHRHIWLCADDYGIAPGVDAAIRDLILKGRLNATSVMTASPNMTRGEASALQMLNSGERRVAIGLHVTLTGHFEPLTADFRPLRRGTFNSLSLTMVNAHLGRFDEARVAAEIAAQVKAFVTLFGRIPDFIDGHQHVHLFPHIREALLSVVARIAPQPWVRQCGRAPGHAPSASDFKGRILERLSRTFGAQAAARGVRTNPAFAGTYTFSRNADFAALFPHFLDGLPDGGLIMCHPGFVDAELERLDPLTTLREKEQAYFSGSEFPAVLAQADVSLAPVTA